MDNKVEKFIQVMESRIKEIEQQYNELSKDDFSAKLITSGSINGLQHALNLFKILNDR